MCHGAFKVEWEHLLRIWIQSSPRLNAFCRCRRADDSRWYPRVHDKSESETLCARSCRYSSASCRMCPACVERLLILWQPCPSSEVATSARLLGIVLMGVSGRHWVFDEMYVYISLDVLFYFGLLTIVNCVKEFCGRETFSFREIRTWILDFILHEFILDYAERKKTTYSTMDIRWRHVFLIKLFMIQHRSSKCISQFEFQWTVEEIVRSLNSDHWRTNDQIIIS